MSWQNILKGKGDARRKRIRRKKKQAYSALGRGENYMPNSKMANKKKKLKTMIEMNGILGEPVLNLLRRDKDMMQIIEDDKELKTEILRQMEEAERMIREKKEKLKGD
tara:strand:- start:113 stop:436 length:324 start_codon:yes stop_codon:yes gene_type:complete